MRALAFLLSVVLACVWACSGELKGHVEEARGLGAAARPTAIVQGRGCRAAVSRELLHRRQVNAGVQEVADVRPPEVVRGEARKPRPLGERDNDRWNRPFGQAREGFLPANGPSPGQRDKEGSRRRAANRYPMLDCRARALWHVHVTLLVALADDPHVVVAEAIHVEGDHFGPAQPCSVEQGDQRGVARTLDSPQGGAYLEKGAQFRVFKGPALCDARTRDARYVDRSRVRLVRDPTGSEALPHDAAEVAQIPPSGARVEIGREPVSDTLDVVVAELVPGALLRHRITQEPGDRTQCHRDANARCRREGLKIERVHRCVRQNSTSNEVRFNSISNATGKKSSGPAVLITPGARPNLKWRSDVPTYTTSVQFFPAQFVHELQGRYPSGAAACMVCEDHNVVLPLVDAFDPGDLSTLTEEQVFVVAAAIACREFDRLLTLLGDIEGPALPASVGFASEVVDFLERHCDCRGKDVRVVSVARLAVCVATTLAAGADPGVQRGVA